MAYFKINSFDNFQELQLKYKTLHVIEIGPLFFGLGSGVPGGITSGLYEGKPIFDEQGLHLSAPFTSKKIPVLLDQLRHRGLI